jgi:hypothetical protein
MACDMPVPARFAARSALGGGAVSTSERELASDARPVATTVPAEGSGGPGGTTLKAEVAVGFGVVSPGSQLGFIQQQSVSVQLRSVPWKGRTIHAVQSLHAQQADAQDASGSAAPETLKLR